jgi:hypothetical protein
MQPTRPRFRLRTLLILVALMALFVAWGVKPRRVGAIYEATSMPGATGFEIPIHEQGWLVRMTDSIFPTFQSDGSILTPTSQTRDRP